jgi:hypothetical protein
MDDLVDRLASLHRAVETREQAVAAYRKAAGLAPAPGGVGVEECNS